MSRVVPAQSGSATANLGSYVSGTSVSTSTSGNPVGRDSTNTSTSYRAQFTLTRNTSPVVIYNIPVDASNIPSNATITSVTAKVRCYVSNTTRVTAATVNLYAGTTAKGTAQDFRTTTSSNVETITGSNISVSDLANLRIQFNMTRNSTNTATYMYLFGADITVNYTIPAQTFYRCSYASHGAETHNANYAFDDDIIPAGSSFTFNITPTTPNVLNVLLADGNPVTTTQSGGTYSYTRTVNADFTLEAFVGLEIMVSDSSGSTHQAQRVYRKVNGQ